MLPTVHTDHVATLAAFILRPVHERLLMTLNSSAKQFAGEPTAPMLDPGWGRTKTGQLSRTLACATDVG